MILCTAPAQPKDLRGTYFSTSGEIMTEWTKPGGDAIDSSSVSWSSIGNPTISDSSGEIPHENGKRYYCYIIPQLQMSTQGYRVTVRVTNSISSTSASLDVLTSKYG